MSDFPAINHVALSVTDLASSAVWYERLLGTEPVLEHHDEQFERKIYPLSDGMLLVLLAHAGADPGERFRVEAPGLDHVGFGCTNREELSSWETRLDELGIPHGGIVDEPYGSGLSFKDPDGNALEFFAAPEGA